MKNKKNLDELKEWGIYLLESIKRLEIEDENQRDLLNKVILAFEHDILHYHATNKLKTLKNLVQEIEFWALNLDPHHLAVVNDIAFKKFGKYVGEDRVLKKTESIIKRGKIRNINEYQLLNEILNLYSGDYSKKDFIDSVAQLIFLFEKNYPAKK
jgi:hypothetical protein